MKPQTPIIGHAAFYPYPVAVRPLWEPAATASAKARKGKRKASGKPTAPKLDRRRLTPPAKALPHRAGKHN